MKKGWVVGCGIVGSVVLVCGGVITALILLVFSTIQQFGKPADEFLAKLGTGDTKSAYQSAASKLKDELTQLEFDDWVRSTRLDQFQSSKWNKFDCHNDQGKLEGTVTLKDGTTLPVTVQLIHEGEWKVSSVKWMIGDSGWDTERLTGPSEKELQALVRRDMSELSRAVKSGDFTTFHSAVSKPFRDQKSAAELKATFREFIEKRIDLSAVQTVEPTIWKPTTIDAEGVLLVEGEYQTRPIQITFRLKYIQPNHDWRLIGINVETKAAE